MRGYHPTITSAKNALVCLLPAIPNRYLPSDPQLHKVDSHFLRRFPGIEQRDIPARRSATRTRGPHHLSILFIQLTGCFSHRGQNN